ncbi:hypothetical protein [Candidatus Enterococcus clewellii]|uniref:Uncharacterized protein n=1 Tax=Candidatus Enterococcus clewellii TaxID=1834193 RepID=A0AAQ3VUK8_9ENTE
MATFRKIVVDGKAYLWKYSFDDYDYQNDSALIIKSADKQGKLLINFRTGNWDHGYCPFNRGVPGIYMGEPVVINLNQPRFIMEIISFSMKHLQLNQLSRTVELNNGIEILNELGYTFDYEKRWD